MEHWPVKAAWGGVSHASVDNPTPAEARRHRGEQLKLGAVRGQERPLVNVQLMRPRMEGVMERSGGLLGTV